jgi:hypothetical protein
VEAVARSKNDAHTLAGLVRRQLADLGATTAALADAIDLPVEYVDDMVHGRRRPPSPGRTDIYDRMTKFLRMGRKLLATAAEADRGPLGDVPDPSNDTAKALMALCNAETAQALAKRGAKADRSAYLQRLLDLVQSAVCRLLEDPAALRIAASRRGTTHAEQRARIHVFVDTTLDALTPTDVAEYVHPRIAQWDVDLETGVLTLVLRGHEPRDRHRRTPSVRRAM